MESLDFVYDLTESLEKQNIDYFVIAIRKTKDEAKADVFYKLQDEESMRIYETVVGNIDVGNDPEVSGEEFDWSDVYKVEVEEDTDPPPKKNKKNERKKRKRRPKKDDENDENDSDKN